MDKQKKWICSISGINSDLDNINYIVSQIIFYSDLNSDRENKRWTMDYEYIISDFKSDKN